MDATVGLAYQYNYYYRVYIACSALTSCYPIDLLTNTQIYIANSDVRTKNLAEEKFSLALACSELEKIQIHRFAALPQKPEEAMGCCYSFTAYLHFLPAVIKQASSKHDYLLPNDSIAQ